MASSAQRLLPDLSDRGDERPVPTAAMSLRFQRWNAPMSGIVRLIGNMRNHRRIDARSPPGQRSSRSHQWTALSGLGSDPTSDRVLVTP